ncbi:aminodeoxychorismate synthase component I [Duganella qianjiadongensis]|uniref:Aminodeoxychorismate synthase component I n=1 Tax=Duganella qianjiadongensis TaxID=2692176 RepID=A0ABW9VP34_9BURK|nr:aminodeoxychorismate synthase component I [Duganella qianjiadongensis]MYM41339.1 aminodeoxychorismate synthase component I [Duganella qianjiadongensis]
MEVEVFALLDDASPHTPPAGAGAPHRSRLYTGHLATLHCQHISQWPQLLEQMQTALTQGAYAVTVCHYELGEQLLQLDGINAAPTAGLAQILLFSRCDLLDSEAVGAWLAARSSAPDSAGNTIAAQPLPHNAGIANIRPNIDQPAFSTALARIHDYIAAGDTYQVNYTYRLRFDAYGSIYALYARLRERQPVPFGALLQLDDGSAILSLSPELFVRHQHGVLTARPMKGTAPACDDEAENRRRAQALAADAKNRAENLMIVDLLRNDVARIATTGSVQVPALFDVQRYSSVLQMTSTITAQLRDDATLADIFAALYPCGSITGAPKRRTMEIIRELEPDPRGIYTGAIGWFDPRSDGKVGDFCMSVPIRTLALQAPDAALGIRRGEMGVGAGIVFDSDAAGEYAECQLKARFLTGLQSQFEIFETLQASHAGARHQARHLARLAASAQYFGYPCDADAAAAAIAQACASMAPHHTYRLRLALSASGELTVQQAAITPLATPVKLLLAADATSASDLFLRHKTSIRTRYDAAWRGAEAQGGFDTLFFNERGELTEGGRSNVLVQLDGRWYTPPLSSGLLPGVMRAVLLDDPQWQIEEAVITRAMLEKAQAIMVCNALRGVIPAVLAG